MGDPRRQQRLWKHRWTGPAAVIASGIVAILLIPGRAEADPTTAPHPSVSLTAADDLGRSIFRRLPRDTRVSPAQTQEMPTELADVGSASPIDAEAWLRGWTQGRTSTK